MKATRKMMAMFSAAGLALGVIAAPSVEITAVQQQYPWTNTVDITYEVQGVTNMEYFVRFTPTTSDDDPILNTEGEASIQVALESNGVFTAQWYPQTNLQYTACKMTPAIFRGGSGGGRDYMIVDLETGEVTYEPMATQEASNERYMGDVAYKTTKMVFRRIKAGQYPVRRGKNGSEYADVATMDKDYYISIFNVTAAQYNRIKDTAPYTEMTPKVNISYATIRGNALARANVISSASGDVVARLNYKVQRHDKNLYFDLPTFAMTQVAAHANQNKDWPWFFCNKDTNLNRYARYANSNRSLGIVGSLGVASANPWGIYDAYGNVWDSCRDTCPYVAWSNSAVLDSDVLSLTQVPTQSGNCRAAFGGGYWDVSMACRTAGCSRDHAITAGYAHTGFRLSMIVE